MLALRPCAAPPHVPPRPRAEEFLPERWLEEGKATLGPSLPTSVVHTPFGGGGEAPPHAWAAGSRGCAASRWLADACGRPHFSSAARSRAHLRPSLIHASRTALVCPAARVCIGFRFALTEAKIALARMYKDVTFELQPGQVPLATKQSVTMMPARGVHVRCQRR